MVLTLRSGRELESRKEDEQKKTEKAKKEEIGKDDKSICSELAEDTEKEEVQTEQQ